MADKKVDDVAYDENVNADKTQEENALAIVERAVDDEDETEEGKLAKLFLQVTHKDARAELVLVSDNPDGSAYALLVRGCFEQPETYLFYISGGIMDPQLQHIVMMANNLRADDIKADAGFYKYMCNVAGVAACFQSDVPGVQLVEAFFGPFDTPLSLFLQAHKVTHYEQVFVKRARNSAYKYRKIVDAARRAEAEAAAAEIAALDAESVDDEENVLIDVEDL